MTARTFSGACCQTQIVLKIILPLRIRPAKKGLMLDDNLLY